MLWLVIAALIQLSSAGDCDNPASWGCDKIKDTSTDCYGAAAKFCGVCKSECNGGEAKETEAPEIVCDPPKEDVCKQCGPDDACEDMLFYITTYGEPQKSRFGCTYPEDYKYTNQDELCPRYTTLVKSDAECKSGDTWLGWKYTKDACVEAAVEAGARFFIYGKSWKSYQCYAEHMETRECKEWEDDSFDVYENILCKDDEEEVKKAMFDDNATCKNTIETYASYGQDLCAEGSEFINKCCVTCGKLNAERAASLAMHTETSGAPLFVNLFAALGFATVLYGAFRHYTNK